MFGIDHGHYVEYTSLLAVVQAKEYVPNFLTGGDDRKTALVMMLSRHSRLARICKTRADVPSMRAAPTRVYQSSSFEVASSLVQYTLQRLC